MSGQAPPLWFPQHPPPPRPLRLIRRLLFSRPFVERHPLSLSVHAARSQRQEASRLQSDGAQPATPVHHGRLRALQRSPIPPWYACCGGGPIELIQPDGVVNGCRPDCLSARPP